MKARFLKLWILCLLLVAGLPLHGFAALSANTVWEVRASTGSDNNGGGFVAGSTGTDYSQQAAAMFSGTDLAVDATTNTKVTSATHNFVAADVGNLLNLPGGGAFTAGFYQIVSVASNAATLDRSPAATSSTGGSWAEGGALATLTQLAAAMVASNKAYCTGAFTSTATTTFAQSVASPSVANPATRLIGYGAVRGDTGQATLTLQTNTGLTGLAATGAGMWFEQIDVECAGLGTSTGIALGSGNYTAVKNCKIANFTTAGLTNSGATASMIEYCEVTGGGSAAAEALQLATETWAIGCNVHDNACPGIAAGASCCIIRCLVTNNTGANSDGIRIAPACFVLNNTIHGNGRHGINNTGATTIANQWRNNVITSNGGFGIVGATSAIPAMPDFDGNAFWNNTSGTRSNMDSVTGIFGVNPYTNVRDVILTASPYVGPTTGAAANFALNNTPGAGAACRAVGSPGAWPGNTGTTSYLDMGAVQHKDQGHGHIIGG